MRPGMVAGVPALEWGPPGKPVMLAVHGLFGNKADAGIRLFASVAVPLGYQVVSVDLPGHGDRDPAERPVPWRAAPELGAVHDALAADGASVGVYACSLGAYFALLGLSGRRVGRALLVAPLVDMRAHIERLMAASGVDDDRLRRAGSLGLPDGRELSWEYLAFAREHPVRWSHPTSVLRGIRDEVVPSGDIGRFAEATGARVQDIDAGHSFTAEHDPIVVDWITRNLAPA